MKLYNNRIGNIFTDTAFVAAQLAKVEVQEIIVSEEEAKSKEFKAKSLTGKFPVLETENGTIVESAAIARYFARLSGSGLNGKDNFEAAQIDQFIDFAHTALVPHLFNIVKAVFHGIGDADSYNNSIKEIKDLLRLVNTHLQGRQYLVGDHLTVADIVVAFAVLLPFQSVLDGGYRKSVVPNVTAWLERFVAIPEVVKRIGHVKFCAKALKSAIPAKEEKKEAPKKEVAKETTEAPKKEVDPLDALPPSKFVLPDFKTYFVNLADKRGEGMKHFFENFDKEGYSIYYAKYDKYEGEGVVLYQTANLMNGFLQRIDEKFRRHVYAIMAITGEEPNLDIESVWIWRGKGIPHAMAVEHPQFEYYNKRELSIDNEEDRKLIADFYCAKIGDTINGKVIQDLKAHK